MVVDVGANRGQFALDVIRAAPDARILSVEPLAEEADVLEQVLRDRPTARVMRVALGSSPGVASMNVLEAADSSSLLAPSSLQGRMFPGMAVVRQATVPVSTLDLILECEQLAHPSLLKIDVQGFELAVIEGGRSRLEDFDFVYVELSYVELYAGQPLITDVMRALFERGFVLEDASAPTRRGRRALQQDFLFKRAL